MNKTLFIFLLLMSNSLFAQYQIKWGELDNEKYKIDTVLQFSSRDFYTVNYKTDNIDPHYGYNPSGHLCRYRDSEMITSGDIYTELENASSEILGTILLDSTPVAILISSDNKYFLKENEEIGLYYQKYSDSCRPIGVPEKIMSFKAKRPFLTYYQEFYSFHVSENKEFIVFDYEIPNETDGIQYGYKIFSADFKLISEGNYEIPDKKSKLVHYLSNTGDYFICKFIYESYNEKIFDINQVHLSKVTLSLLTNEEKTEVDLKLENGGVVTEQITLFSNKNQLVSLSGLYASGDKGHHSEIKGLVSLKIDFKKEEIVSEDIKVFDFDFISQGLTDQQIQKLKKNSDKGKNSDEIVDYVFRQSIPLRDGSFIGIMEQYEYISSNSSVYPLLPGKEKIPDNPRMLGTSQYNYGDVIVYKLNNAGEFQWADKIIKEQKSQNDLGYYSSFSTFELDGNLMMLFTDNLKNYDESGNYHENTDKTAGTRSVKPLALALLEFDLSDGKYTRKNILTNQKANITRIAPRKFVFDSYRKELLVVSSFIKEQRVGILSF